MVALAEAAVLAPVTIEFLHCFRRVQVALRGPSSPGWKIYGYASVPFSEFRRDTTIGNM